MVAKIHTEITYPLKNPKKKPNILSRLPIPVYVTALLIPLLINKITKIIITKRHIPRITSRTYSLSIISFTYGFALGNINKVITYANNHFEADNKLKTKPFL